MACLAGIEEPGKITDTEGIDAFSAACDDSEHVCICNTKNGGIEMSKKMTPEEVVRAWSDAYVSKDLDATSALMSEDFIRLGDSTHWTPINKHDWREVMENFFTAFPDWSWDMTSLIASGDRVVCEFTEKGTFTEPYPIMPGLVLRPTGESFTDYDCDCFEVKDGLITEIRAYVTNEIERRYSFISKIEEFLATDSAPGS
jgi:ketosteroid isomerase-like protein